eukprot:6356608-Pyramimonas_sp.AAC.1
MTSLQGPSEWPRRGPGARLGRSGQSQPAQRGQRRAARAHNYCSILRVCSPVPEPAVAARPVL